MLIFAAMKKVSIDIPDRTTNGGRPAKYNFDDIEVGQGYAIEDGENEHSISVAARAYGKRRGKVFVQRMINGVLHVLRKS
jgi:hypothetical protein